MPDIEEDTLEGDIRAAFDSASSSAFAGDGPAPGATQDAQDPAPADGVRPRNERGQFASRALADGPAEGAAASQSQPLEKAQDQAQHAASPAQGAAEPAQSAIQPPHALRATVKAKWAALDPEVQQELVRLDKTVVDSRTEWSSKGERLNRFDELLSPIRDQLALRGTDEFRFIQGLVMADGLLRGPNAEQALADIAAMYGLRPPPQAQPGQNGRPQGDPQFQTLQREVADLRGQLQQKSQADEQAFNRTLSDQVQAFRAATNPDGSLKHLYFDNVRELMGDLLDAKRATDLDTAYEMAIHADPDVRKLVTTAQPRGEPRPLEPKGLSITGAPTHGGKSVQVASTGSIEDDVRSAYRELAGAV